MLPGTASLSPSVPVQSCFQDSYWFSLTWGAGEVVEVLGPQEGWPACLHPHTSLGFTSGTTGFME